MTTKKKILKECMYKREALMKHSNNNNDKTLKIDILKAGWYLETLENAGTRWQAPRCHPKFCHCKVS
ncbi:MAG: hypothetical protein ACRCVL_00615 [Cetobacterium sp.]